MVSCAASITVLMYNIGAGDLWGGILTARHFLVQRHVISVAPQDVCNLVEFCSQGVAIPLSVTELVEGKALGYTGLLKGEAEDWCLLVQERQHLAFCSCCRSRAYRVSGAHFNDRRACSPGRRVFVVGLVSVVEHAGHFRLLYRRLFCSS